MKKIVLILAICAAAAVFFGLGLERYLTLEYLKASQQHFHDLYARRTVAVLGGYFALYVLVTALSLPGAAIMTLAGGALFGFWVGTLVVSFASSVGATLACLVARYLLRDWVQARFGDKLSKINDGIAREGAFYLFTLRLIPVFPFFLINLLMGLTKLPLATFYWVSQAGMLAGTLVYVNAGSQLAGIDSLSSILSPGLIFSFVLLGVFPLAVKRLLGLYKTKRP
jgi:uncharacterized membrane protein YdjX (TVP38/TMEM64 family)